MPLAFLTNDEEEAKIRRRRKTQGLRILRESFPLFSSLLRREHLKQDLLFSNDMRRGWSRVIDRHAWHQKRAQKGFFLWKKKRKWSVSPSLFLYILLIVRYSCKFFFPVLHSICDVLCSLHISFDSSFDSSFASYSRFLHSCFTFRFLVQVSCTGFFSSVFAVRMLSWHREKRTYTFFLWFLAVT